MIRQYGVYTWNILQDIRQNHWKVNTLQDIRSCYIGHVDLYFIAYKSMSQPLAPSPGNPVIYIMKWKPILEGTYGLNMNVF